MNVLVVMGSPFKNGNVSKLTQQVANGAKDAGHTIKQYNVFDMNVLGCQGCRECKNNNVDCILNDDLKPYWADLHNAGALVVSSPLYCGTVCGPMITYMNRHSCILDLKYKSTLRPGIKLIGIFSQSRSEKDFYFDEYDWYLKDFENRDMVRHGMVVNAGVIPVDNIPSLMSEAYMLGNTL